MVMHGSSSRDSDFDHDAMAPLSVFESPMLSIGSRTDVEMMLTILPLPAFFIPGESICTSV